MQFKSPMEKIAYPILHTMSIQYGLVFQYQRPIGWQSGGYATAEDYCSTYSKEYEDWMENTWEDSRWGSPEYYIDFVLETEYIKLAIEIDGEQYHQDEAKEQRRDMELKKHGYFVVHIPAKIVLKEFEFKQLVLKELEIINP